MEGGNAALENLCVSLLDAFLPIVSRGLDCVLGLFQLVLNGLTIDRAKVMLPAAINVEQVNEIFPALIERFQVGRNLFAVGELAVVRIDLIFHPPQVLDRLALSWVECLDKLFPLGIAQPMLSLLLAALNITAVERTGWHYCQINRFAAQTHQQRRDIPEKGGCDGEPCHAPEI